MKENKIQSEAKIQAESVKWFTNNFCLKHHNPKFICFSVPNEAIQKMAWQQINTFKAMGLKSGVSDVIVLLEGKVLFVEFKAAKGAQTPKQKSFQEDVQTLGFEYHICRSLEDFQDLVSSNVKVSALTENS